ncbi:winged helix-turn-helix domain-containing protein [Lysobacter silvisoli]|uniref:ArsR family transcriptional regulator n=1 Tax=Lysobacter silvisoli TaxID=2293254 RepID=A0A371K241_9GAMM|nr:winged helix-turn-helix domain-containing protein [Lysobacter silvisoli]RDZ27991.1 ArsR family transcriptional regulator [Lysobacter silvisoli]
MNLPGTWPPQAAIATRSRGVTALAAAATERTATLASALTDAFGNPKRGQILFYAASSPGLSIGDLSSLLGCSVSLASQYVAQLEAQGWLTVVSDGRRRRVCVADDSRCRAIETLRALADGLGPAPARLAAGER